MTDQSNSAQVDMRFVVDRNTLAQFKQAVDSARTNLSTLGGEAAKSTEQFKQLNSISAQIGREQSIQQMGRDYAQLGKLIKDDTKALQDMQAAMKGVGSSAEDINKAAEAFKNFQDARGGSIEVSGLRRTGSALSQLGLEAIGQPVQTIGNLGQVLKELGVVSEATQVSVSATTVAIGTMEVATGPLVIVLAAAAALVAALVVAQQRYNDELKAGNAAVDAAISDKERFYAAVYSMTSEDAKKAIEAEKVKSRIANDVAGDIRDVINAQEAATPELANLSPQNRDKAARQLDQFKELFVALDKYNAELDSSQAYIDQLTKAVKDNKFAVNDAKKAKEEEMQKIENARITATKYWELVIENQTKAVTAAQQLAAKEKAEQDRKDKDSVSILTKRDADIKTIEDRGAQSRIDLQARTADKVAQITQQAIDAADASLAKLKDKLADLTTSLARGTEDAEIKAQRADIDLQIKGYEKDRDALVAHLRKVEEIKKSFDASERDAVYDRNFDQLFRLQENKADQLKAEDKASAEAKKDRDQAFTDERSQLARQRQYESQDRLRAYQRSLQDAQVQYQRELIQQQQAAATAIQRTNDAARVELSNLNNKIEAEKTLRRNQAVAEISLVNQTEYEKWKIFQHYLSEVRALSGQAATFYQNPTVAGTAGGTTFSRGGGGAAGRMFAGGGSPPVGVPSLVNEPRTSSGRETFSAGGKTVRLPGFGLFTPLTGGTVNANTTSDTSNNVTIVVNGNDTEAMKRAIISVLRPMTKRQ